MAGKPLIGNAASPEFVSKTVERSIRTKSAIRESEETGLSKLVTPSWTPGQTTSADLAKTTLQFRHRLVRSPSAPKTPLSFGLRLEPDSTTDPHGKSIRLPSFESSDEWRTLTVSQGTAANQDVFLEHINSANTNRLQLTSDWPASDKSLQAGDTILIDDVKFLSQ